MMIQMRFNLIFSDCLLYLFYLFFFLTSVLIGSGAANTWPHQREPFNTVCTA